MSTPRPTVRRLTGGLAALALGATLTACGGSGPDAADDPAAAAPSSSAPAEDTPSADASDASGATEEPQEYDDGGQVDPDQFVARLQDGIAKTKYAHIEFTMGGAGGEMKGSGDVDYTATPPNMQMSMDLGPQSVGMLLVDKIMYVQSTQAGGKYIKFDLDDPNNPLGSGLSEQLDPAGSVEAFTKAVTSVTSMGSEDVDGQTLDRYELTVDTTQLADDGTGSNAALPPEVTMVVWLDDEGRMAKTSMGLGPVQYDATLTDFDKAVELEAPPANQVVSPPAA
jgi:hypothetical protein